MRQLKISKQITNRESQSLDKYLQEIGKVDLLIPDEEVELAKRIREGDQMALEKLTKANLRFVVSVAKQYQNQGLSLGDLINEGNLGLIKAAQRFDETRGFKFISYAVWWIRQSILQALAEQSRIVRLPLNRVGSLNKISKTFSALEQRFEREPSPDELAGHRQCTNYWFRTGRLYCSHLCFKGRIETGAVSGRATRGSINHNKRCGELPGLSGGHQRTPNDDGVSGAG
jgi:RNA polymerase sigma factor (sigma-70 family)